MSKGMPKEYLLCDYTENTCQKEEPFFVNSHQSNGIYISEEETPNFTSIKKIMPNHDPINPYITLSECVELCGILENYVHDFIMYRQDFWDETKQLTEAEFDDFLWSEVFSAKTQKNSKQYIIGTSRFLSCEKEIVSYSKSKFQTVKGRLLRKWAASSCKHKTWGNILSRQIGG